jgi:hypothetical protein
MQEETRPAWDGPRSIDGRYGSTQPFNTSASMQVPL